MSNNTQEAIEKASADIVQAMSEREADPFAEIHVRIVKAQGKYVAVETETKKRVNLG